MILLSPSSNILLLPTINSSVRLVAIYWQNFIQTLFSLWSKGKWEGEHQRYVRRWGERGRSFENSETTAKVQWQGLKIRYPPKIRNTNTWKFCFVIFVKIYNVQKYNINISYLFGNFRHFYSIFKISVDLKNRWNYELYPFYKLFYTL